MSDLISLKEFFELDGLYKKENRIVLPFHEKIFKTLELLTVGSLPGGKKNLMILIPPRHSKTYSVMNFIAWSMGYFPDSQFIYTSYSATMAEAKTQSVRDIFLSDYYKKLFRAPKPTKEKAAFFENEQGGTVYGAGFGGTITGFGAGRKRHEFGGAIIIDDPIKPQDALSTTVRESTNKWYTNTLKSRKNYKDTPIILIMQRLHKNDLAGYIQEYEGEDWHILKLPALNIETGKSLWEETVTADELLKLKERDPFTFYSQYQQDPIVAGGQVIKPEWIKFYNSISPDSIDQIFIVADTAQKTSEHNDFTVFAAFAKTKDGLALIDLIRGKWDAVDLEYTAISFWNKNHYFQSRICSGFYVEDKSSGTGLIQSLQRKTGIPIISVQRNRDKLSRLLDVLAYFQSGKISLPINGQYGANPQILSEFESFRRDMAHDFDDIIDVFIDAINIAMNQQSILDAL